jgi:ribosomal 30S subunit maturation factor RimM
VVTGWQEYGGPGLLEVERPDGGRILVPFARSICTEIDLEARSIRVDLPEGLEDLSA